MDLSITYDFQIEQSTYFSPFIEIRNQEKVELFQIRKISHISFYSQIW